MAGLSGLELEVLYHRYLYYVLGEPEITDYEYDMLERRLGREQPGSAVFNSVGSSLAGDYPPEVAERASGRVRG